jgi:small basic protein
VELVATAHTWTGGDGPYSVAPIVGFMLTVLLIRAVLRFPVGLAVIGISTVFGALFATLGERWGYTVTLSSYVLAVVLLARIQRAGAVRRNRSD